MAELVPAIHALLSEGPMKKTILLCAFSLVATSVEAFPVVQFKSADEMIVLVRKGGGSYRSAKSGRFVSRSYGSGHKSTTVKHGKY
jgi:hypothetical protein